MKVRYITPVAREAYIGVTWEGRCHTSTSHRATRTLARWDYAVVPRDDHNYWDWPYHLSDFPLDTLPVQCDRCPATRRPDAGDRFGGTQITWSTPSGQQEPGDMWWASWVVVRDAGGALRSRWWDNESDPRGHLMVKLPNGHVWDIDARASNCGREADRTHRCWIRHGEPPLITVDKNGDTCSAGAGSILAGDYHGFLRNGELT